MKKSLLFTVMLVAFGAVAPAGAAIVTANPLDHAPGTDVSTAYPGLDMRMLSPSGTTTYAPIASPVLTEACTSYGPCPGFGPLASFGGIASNGHDYEHCYDVTLAGGTTYDCRGPWEVLDLNFPDGTDFIEVTSLWNIDPPAIVAYDAAGNEILFCKPVGPGNPAVGPGSPAGCITSQQFGPGQEFVGTSRLQTASPIIARVVFASWAGSAIATQIQYSWTKCRRPPCGCKERLLGEVAKPLD